MTVELRNRLNSEIKPVPPLASTALFDYPTIAELGQHLAVLVDLQGDHRDGEVSLSTLELLRSVTNESLEEMETQPSISLSTRPSRGCKVRPDAETSDAKRKALLIIRRQAERIEEPESSQLLPSPWSVWHAGCPAAGMPANFGGCSNRPVGATAEVPADRWDIDRYYSDGDAPGKMCTRFGAFLDQID